jgi:hypothetical protein
MKYRLTPFNILAAIFILLIILYFFNAITQTDYDHHGWSAVFTLFPSVIFMILFGGVDLIIQIIFTSKKYKWILITEGVIFLLILIWQWRLISAFLNL